jgi:hypothetical protein
MYANPTPDLNCEVTSKKVTISFDFENPVTKAEAAELLNNMLSTDKIKPEWCYLCSPAELRLTEDMTDLEKFAINEARYRVDQILGDNEDIEATPEQIKEIRSKAETNLINYLMYDENALNYDGIDEKVNSVFKEVIGYEV